MKKKLFCHIILLSLIFMILFNVDVRAKEFDIDAKSGLLIEVSTGKILYEKNINERYAPASVTKIMTMLLTMEAIDNGKINMSDKITISEAAKKMGGSTMLLETGEVRTVEEILKGIAIASGNDAAVAISEYLCGSQEAFVEKMNLRAKQLGMNNTNFKNSTGLPEKDHYSTAKDISIMSLELLKHKKILNYSSIYMETISDGRKAPIELVNHNKLVRFFDGCDGLKTGYTEEAKYCISSTACKNGVRVLAVVMGSPTYKIRNQIASNLMNLGLSRFENKNIVIKDSDVERVVIDKKGKQFYILKATENINVILERGTKAKLDKKIKITSKNRSYKAGEIVGEVEYFSNKSLIAKSKVYCDRNIRLNGFFDNFKDNILNLIDNAI